MSFRDAPSGADLRCAIAHRGISSFRVRRFAPPRNDERSYLVGGAGHGRCGPRKPSNAFAIPSTPRSSKRRPTICTPIGKPLALKPPLIEAAGFSDMFHGTV